MEERNTYVLSGMHGCHSMHYQRPTVEGKFWRGLAVAAGVSAMFYGLVVLLWCL